MCQISKPNFLTSPKSSEVRTSDRSFQPVEENDAESIRNGGDIGSQVQGVFEMEKTTTARTGSDVYIKDDELRSTNGLEGTLLDMDRADGACVVWRQGAWGEEVL